MEPEIDRRRLSRVKLLNWPAKILIKDKTIDGTTRNISTHGAFLYYYRPHGNDLPLQLGQVVDLIIEPPDEAPLFMPAEVIWSNILSSDEKNTLLGVGLHFIQVSDKNRKFLHDFVTAHTDSMLEHMYNHPKQQDSSASKEVTGFIIDQEEIIARMEEGGKSIACKNCMSDIDLTQIARDEIILRGTIDDLYGKGKIIFCDSCGINLYRFVSELESIEAEESTEDATALPFLDDD